MKKIKNLIPLFLLFLLLSGCKKEESLGSVADIEDAQFLSYVLKEFDTNDDAVLSNDEIMAVTSMYIYNLNIHSLKGIEMFNNLDTLACFDNSLESLDVSKNIKLISLSCSTNNLTALKINDNINLKILQCSGNNLISLDVSKNIKLTFLYCSNNNLTSLYLNNAQNIRYVNCAYNNLTSLDVSSNSSLKSINCTQNPDLKVLYMPKDNQNCEIEKDAHTEVVYK